MNRLLLVLASFLAGTNCPAVIISEFPGLDVLIEKADAIVILRIDGHIEAHPGPSLYTTHHCLIYQSLKGDITPRTRMALQLMDARPHHGSPFALYSSHLVFLTRKRSPNEKTEYRTLEIQGASIRLSPFGHEKMPEGKTTAAQVRSLVQTSLDFWSEQQKKENDFLSLVSAGELAPYRPESELKYWTERANQIAVGTRREEVERLLPPYRPPPWRPELSRYAFVTGTVTGGAKGLTYYVSPGYKVTVFYDYTGVPRDATGQATSTDSPDSRAVAPVKLSHEPIPERK